MSTITAPAAGFAPRRSAAVPVPVRPAVRLTRRGRLLVSALAVLLLVGTAVLATGGGLASALTPGSGPAAVERVTVRPGETLWAIAERTAPGVDPRKTVAEIMDLNALETSAVPAGSVLLLPR